MDVWVVTLNGYVQHVCDSPASADAAIDDVKRHLASLLGRAPGEWRAIGGNPETAEAWTAHNVTSLARKRWAVRRSALDETQDTFPAPAYTASDVDRMVDGLTQRFSTQDSVR